MKKYALVRVDGSWCPHTFERIDKHYVCVKRKNGTSNCKKCLYGDTKEQLKMKIATAIKQSLKKSESNNFKAKVLAGIIVEFLGVKE